MLREAGQPEKRLYGSRFRADMLVHERCANIVRINRRLGACGEDGRRSAGMRLDRMREAAADRHGGSAGYARNGVRQAWSGSRGYGAAAGDMGARPAARSGRGIFPDNDATENRPKKRLILRLFRILCVYLRACRARYAYAREAKREDADDGRMP